MMQNMLGKQIGNFRITATIAAGSFGSVYKAKHLVFDDEPAVAIKLLHAHLGSEKEQKRFLQEARFLRKLKHPAIQPVLDAGLYEGFLFFIMEFASNGSLGDRLHRQASQPLHIGEALIILAQVAQGLQHAHDQNIVHRDLKPANILFSTTGEALLADFGIAVVLEQTKRVEKEGSPPYMAPEQFRGEISKKSDQYALGCIAYELFTGQQPFVVPEPSFEAMGYMHGFTQPLPPMQLNPNLPGYMEQAILKAMAKQREDRYESIAAFIAALQAAPDPTVIETKKTADLYKSEKDWLREGNAFLDKKQYQESIEAYEQAIRLDANNASAHNGKGVALNRLGRYEEVLRACEQEIRLDANNATFYDEKGKNLDWLGSYEEALRACEQAIRLDPNDATFHGDKGVTLNGLGRYEEALKAYEQAIRLDANNATFHGNKGNALYGLGRYEEALRAYEQAIRLDPNDEGARNNKDAALEELKKANRRRWW